MKKSYLKSYRLIKQLKTIPILFALLVGNVTNGQLAIETNFNSAFATNSQSVLLKLNRKKISFLIGPKFAFNYEFSSQHAIGPKKSLFALSLGERVGLNFRIQFLLIKSEQLVLSTFYDFQFSRSHRRFTEYRPNELLIVPWIYNNDTNSTASIDEVLFAKYDAVYGPALAFEHTFGLDLQIKLGDHFYLTQRIGGGVTIFNELNNKWGPDDDWTDPDGYSYYWNYTGAFRHLSSMFSFGMGYNFKKK